MSIQKIEIEESIWEITKNEKGERKNVFKGKEIITHTREGFKGNFDRLILQNIKDYDVQDYAECSLGMIDEDDCECDTTPDDFSTEILIRELQDRGYEIIKCATITDSLKLQKVKELMEL